MIKRVRLDYKPVAKRRSEEAAFVVSAEHVAAVNRSIEKKLERNKRERRAAKAALFSSPAKIPHIKYTTKNKEKEQKQ